MATIREYSRPKRKKESKLELVRKRQTSFYGISEIESISSHDSLSSSSEDQSNVYNISPDATNEEKVEAIMKFFK